MQGPPFSWLLLAGILLCSATRSSAADFPSGAILGDTFTVKAGSRKAGSSLNGQKSEVGGGIWSTAGKVVVTADGSVTVDDESAGMGLLTLPNPNDAVELSADMMTTGAGFVALALLPDKSPGDFWRTTAVFVFVTSGGDYQIFTHGDSKVVKKGSGSEYGFKKDGLNHVALRCDPSSKTISVKINETAILPDTVIADLPALVSAAFRFNEKVTPGVPRLGNFAISPTPAALRLTSKDSKQFYVLPDAPAVLRWEHSPTGVGSVKDVVVRDYAGHNLSRLPVSAPAPGVKEVAVKLPRGFYTLFFPETGQEYGLVALPAFTGARDTFFSIDAGLSQLMPLDHQKNLIAVMQRLGIACARERLWWANLEPKAGAWDWQTRRRLDDTRQWYAQAGVGVLEMVIGTPDWMEKDAAKMYPRDLLTAASDWGHIGQHWQSIWQGLEIWNEPDLASGGNEPADQYMATLKAVRLGLRSNHVDTPVVGGVFAYFNKNYLDLAARNGLLEQSDAISFHYYGEPADLRSRIDEYRSWMRNNGNAGVPLWITEIGPAWEGVPGTRSPAKEDITRALKFARNTVEARACGIARVFPFVLADYSELGLKNFGMLDPAESPLRVMGVYAEAIQELAGSRYIGDLKFAPGSRVFQRDDKTVVIASVDQEIPKTWPFPLTEIRGIDGRTLTAPAPGDGLTYLSAKLADVQGSLERNTPASGLLAEAAPANRKLAPLSAVILTPIVEGNATLSTARGYQLAEGATKVHVRIRASNFGKTEQSLKLRFAAMPPGDTGAGSDLGTEPLTIATNASGEVAINVPVEQLKADNAGMSQIRVSAGEGIAPVAINFLLQRDLQAQLAAHAYRFALPISELNRWKENSAGREVFSKTESGGWADELTFPGGDNWAYPQFTPPQEVDPDKVTAVLVRARCKSAGTVGIMTWDERGKNFYTPFPIIKADGEWHVALVPLDSFITPKADRKIGRQVRMISVGMNSTADANRLEVSDLYLLGN